MGGPEVEVSDSRSHSPSQLLHAARVIGPKGHKRKVFEAVYFGKKTQKTVAEICRMTRLTRLQVLNAGIKLTHKKVIRQASANGEIWYGKAVAYVGFKDEILKLARGRSKQKAFAHRTFVQGGPTVKIAFSSSPKTPRAREISIEDFREFRPATAGKYQQGPTLPPLAESTFKRGVQRIFLEKGKFQDWGGERNDLLTTRAHLGGRRLAVAFAFKGPGVKGILHIKNLGKQGDQLVRLFESPADVFVLQYHGQVGEDVRKLMASLSTASAFFGHKPILWGIIDGQDSGALRRAFPSAFGHR